ncbi:MAG TPA: hypothetical protein VHD90_24325 [Phototrophicaceae bacterium]|nr:hypothetical protein [Phototrophicaceae bacterium]
MNLQTEFEFVLPKGFLDDEGRLHREGTMRLATAIDEIAPLRDPRVRSNEAYLVVILLSQVITRLGGYANVTPQMVERFFAADLAYLQDLYQRINEVDSHSVLTVCPNCHHEFTVEMPLLGEL